MGDDEQEPSARSVVVAAARIIVVAAWVSATVVAAPAPVGVVVESGRFVFEPAWIRVRVQVEPDAANRWLVVEMDSGAFYRRSDEQMEGDRSPRTRWVDWPDTPAGTYAVSATVDRGAERPWRATTTVVVLGR